MSKKVILNLCAGLCALSVVPVANADLVQLSLTGDANSIDYVVDVQQGVFGGFDLEFVSARIGGATYDSSSYNMVLEEGEISSFAIFESVGGDLVSRMTFNGYVGATDSGLLGMFYYGDQVMYDAESYVINSTVNSDGSLGAVFYDQMDAAMDITRVSVSPVSAVPVPAAVWLFGSGLIGLAGIARRRS